MKKSNQSGALNVLLIPLLLVSILFIVAIVYALSIYGKEQDYKNNSDQKVAVAVKAAETLQQKVDAKHYEEVAKQPLRTYNGPSDFGNIVIKYPRTWSIYADQSGESGNPIDGYGYPGVVPGQGQNGQTAYALRFQVNNNTYDQMVANYQQQVQSNQVTVTAYKPKNIPGVVGVRVTGEIQNNKNGDMVILPLRNQTFEIWTESPNFEQDFNNYILPNFSFSP